MEIIEPFQALISPVYAMELLSKVITDNIGSIGNPFEKLEDWMSGSITYAVNGIMGFIDNLIGDESRGGGEESLPVTPSAIDNLRLMTGDELPSEYNKYFGALWDWIDDNVENHSTAINYLGIVVGIISLIIAIKGLKDDEKEKPINKDSDKKYSKLDERGLILSAIGLLFEVGLFSLGIDSDLGVAFGFGVGVLGVVMYIGGVIQEKKIDKPEAGLVTVDFGIDCLLFYSHFR